MSRRLSVSTPRNDARRRGRSQNETKRENGTPSEHPNHILAAHSDGPFEVLCRGYISDNGAAGFPVRRLSAVLAAQTRSPTCFKKSSASPEVLTCAAKEERFFLETLTTTMGSTFDITCDHCGTIVRVSVVGYGTDERNAMDCPQCQRQLFSWQDGMVCDVIGVAQADQGE